MNTKTGFVFKNTTNRMYEKRPNATANKAYKNASEKIKKKIFFIMRIVSEYCILLCRKRD